MIVYPTACVLVPILLSLSIVFSFQSSCKEGDLIRYVAGNGTNTRTCLNSSEPRADPCRTLNFALLEDDSHGTNVSDDCEPSVTPNNLCIRLEDGIHRLTGEAQATRVTNLTIEAVNPHEAVIRCREFPNDQPDVYDNLVFLCSRNVMVQGVIVEECGPVSAGIYSYRTDGLVIQDTIFRNTFGLGMQLDEVNNLLLKNCTFVANVNHLTSDGEDFDESVMRVNDLDTFGLSGGGLYALASTSSLIALIEDCRFVNNKDTFEFNKSKRPPLFRLDGHGGGAFIRITKVANSSVVFRNTIFDSNSAIVDGGAVYVSMSGPASNNSIRFEHCLFYNNSVTDTSGGAISVVMYNGTKESEVVVQNCVFEENSATGGGAIGFVVYDIGDLLDDILVSIESSSFKHNQARTEGSAIGAYSLSHVDVVPFQIQIQNCTFEENDANDTSINEEDVARGAVSLFRFPITFKGKNRFYRNIGGGVSTVESQITVAENSHLIFEDNSANYGGGLQLVGASLFVVNCGSVVDFVNNTAHVLGGGIMVDSPDFISNFLNRFCFIRYSDPDVPPQSWENVSINFINNSATVGGAALYGSNLKRCSWLNLTASSSKDYTIFTPPEGLSVPFVFSGNYLNSNETEQIVKNMSLGTNPVKVNITILIENNDYRLQPGETFSVNIFNQDNFGNSRRGIMCVEFHALNVTFRDAEKCTNYAVGDDHETVSFRVPGIVHENAVKNTPANITFRLPMYSGEDSSVNFTLTICHPGYKLHDGKCVCNSIDPDVFRCDPNSRYIYIREGTFANLENENTSFTLLNGVPASLLNCTREGQLPGCRLKFDDPDDQCADGRMDFFCGRCPQGGVALNLRSCSGNCEVGPILFVLWSVGIVVAACLLIVFNVELPAELRATIFYVQVIGLVFGPYSAIADNDLKNFGLFLNLLTFGLPLPFCLAEGVPAFVVALLGFVTPLLALAVVIIYSICARFNSTISSRGAIHGLSLLSLFIYKYLSDASLTIVSCRVTADDFVFRYDGTQSCLSGEYLPFFVIAILIIFTVILPAPCVLCVLTARRWTKFGLYHFIDQITKDVHLQRGWYAGWDIGRRLMFIMVFFGGVYVDTSLRLLANFLTATVVLLVHLLTKPFREDRNNIIETVILLNFVIVTVSYLEPPVGAFHKVIVVTLTVVPYFFALGFLLMKIAKKILKKCGCDIQSILLNSKFSYFIRQRSEAGMSQSMELQENLLKEDNNSLQDYEISGSLEAKPVELKRRRLRVGNSASDQNENGSRNSNISSVWKSDVHNRFTREVDLFDYDMD